MGVFYAELKIRIQAHCRPRQQECFLYPPSVFPKAPESKSSRHKDKQRRIRPEYTRSQNIREQAGIIIAAFAKGCKFNQCYGNIVIRKIMDIVQPYRKEFKCPVKIKKASPLVMLTDILRRILPKKCGISQRHIVFHKIINGMPQSQRKGNQPKTGKLFHINHPLLSVYPCTIQHHNRHCRRD